MTLSPFEYLWLHVMAYPESRKVPVPRVPRHHSCRLSNIQSEGGRCFDKILKLHCNPMETHRRSPAGNMPFPVLSMVTDSLPLWPRRCILEWAFPISFCVDVGVTRFATRERSYAIPPWICNPSMPRGRTTAYRNGCVPVITSMVRKIPQGTKTSSRARKGNVPPHTCECSQTLTAPML